MSFERESLNECSINRGRTGTHRYDIALESHASTPGCPLLQHARVHQESRACDWHSLFRAYGAVVDWPAASFWYEISEAFPEAVIVLTVRDANSWWESANATIFRVMREASANPVLNAVDRVFAARFTSRIGDRAASIAAFEDHCADVRARAASDRLLEWHPEDGWEPLCARLELPVPVSDFPHVNTREEFVERLGRGRP